MPLEEEPHPRPDGGIDRDAPPAALPLPLRGEEVLIAAVAGEELEPYARAGGEEVRVPVGQPLGPVAAQGVPEWPSICRPSPADRPVPVPDGVPAAPLGEARPLDPQRDLGEEGDRGQLRADHAGGDIAPGAGAVVHPPFEVDREGDRPQGRAVPDVGREDLVVELAILPGVEAEEHLHHAAEGDRRVPLPPEDIGAVDPQLQPRVGLEAPPQRPEPGRLDPVPILDPREEELEPDRAQVVQDPGESDRVRQVEAPAIEALVPGEDYPATGPLVEPHGPPPRPEPECPEARGEVCIIQPPLLVAVDRGDIQRQVWREGDRGRDDARLSMPVIHRAGPRPIVLGPVPDPRQDLAGVLLVTHPKPGVDPLDLPGLGAGEDRIRGPPELLHEAEPVRPGEPRERRHPLPGQEFRGLEERRHLALRPRPLPPAEPLGREPRGLEPPRRGVRPVVLGEEGGCEAGHAPVVYRCPLFGSPPLPGEPLIWRGDNQCCRERHRRRHPSPTLREQPRRYTLNQSLTPHPRLLRRQTFNDCCSCADPRRPGRPRPDPGGRRRGDRYYRSLCAVDLHDT